MTALVIQALRRTVARCPGRPPAAELRGIGAVDYGIAAGATRHCMTAKARSSAARCGVARMWHASLRRQPTFGPAIRGLPALGSLVDTLQT
jgi:hypothetical protein